EAIAAFQESADLTNRSPRAIAGLGHAYGLAGLRSEALAIAGELRSRGATALAGVLFRHGLPGAG
ncbi:MAG TPA: hypothetical protein VGS58_05575, partial [Candidatus Sulfopaludibacter sp.]|nr:hypothetical protein [Candidatus Sulfopaludibacter sp.]